MMKNLKRAVPMRKYQERGQPQRRAKLGLLEKKKDYKERAINYHAKEDQLNKLREKAALRNPDEFYMKMGKTKMVDGKLQVAEDKRDSKQQIIDQTKNTSLVLLKKQMEEEVNINSRYREQENLIHNYI